MTSAQLVRTLCNGKALTHFRDPAKKEYFTLSEKQFKWLWGVFAIENNNADSSIGATIQDDEGNLFGINWNNYIWEKYGRTFYIHFVARSYGKFDYGQRKKESPRQ